MNILFVLLAALILSGCQGINLIPDVSPSGAGPEEGKKFLVDALNYWLGKPKDERVRVFGAPSQCTRLQRAQEKCEWTKSNQQVVFLYDPDGIAKSWSYRGDFGHFNNANHQMVKAESVAAKAPQRAVEWAHPSKAGSALTDEMMNCQSKIMSDPNSINTAQGSASGGKGPSDQQIEQCLKQNGWVRKESP